MANSTVTNPIVIDTWTADVTISAHPIPIKSIIVESNTAEDLVVLEDDKGVEIFRMRTSTANQTYVWTPSQPVVFKNMYLDVSDCTITGTAKMLIYS